MMATENQRHTEKKVSMTSVVHPMMFLYHRTYKIYTDYPDTQSVSAFQLGL
jgi:hypothetical protein